MVIEVNYEPLKMWGGSCGVDVVDSFDCFFGVEMPLDIAEVTAVIFNDYRIEVDE